MDIVAARKRIRIQAGVVDNGRGYMESGYGYITVEKKNIRIMEAVPKRWSAQNRSISTQMNAILR